MKSLEKLKLASQLKDVAAQLEDVPDDSLKEEILEHILVKDKLNGVLWEVRGTGPWSTGMIRFEDPIIHAAMRKLGNLTIGPRYGMTIELNCHDRTEESSRLYWKLRFASVEDLREAVSSYEFQVDLSLVEERLLRNRNVAWEEYVEAEHRHADATKKFNEIKAVIDEIKSTERKVKE